MLCAALPTPCGEHIELHVSGVSPPPPRYRSAPLGHWLRGAWRTLYAHHRGLPCTSRRTTMLDNFLDGAALALGFLGLLYGLPILSALLH